jgi:N-acetylmuramoyl-L-alanine amidase
MTIINHISKKAVIAWTAFVLTTVLVTVFIASVPQTSAAEFPNILLGRDLAMGTTGQDVIVLQGLMSELGYLNVPSGVPFGYYGTLTKNAVAQYQAALNVSPTMGYFGPITKTAMRAQFSQHGWLPLLGW